MHSSWWFLVVVPRGGSAVRRAAELGAARRTLPHRVSFGHAACPSYSMTFAGLTPALREKLLKSVRLTRLETLSLPLLRVQQHRTKRGCQLIMNAGPYSSY